MLSIIYLILGIYFTFLVTWTLYVASMQFLYFKDRLYPFAKFNAYIVWLVMVILDIIINIIMSVPLLEPPRWDKKEFLLSPRLKRWNKTNNWRGKIACWFCEHYLNQFDRDGDHC